MTGAATTIVDRLKVAGFSSGWSAIRHLPAHMAYAAFRGGADVVWRRRGPSVQRLEANLRRAAGDPGEVAVRTLSRAAVRSYLRYWCDAFRIQDWSSEEITGRVRTEREDRLHDAIRHGNGVVVALPHMGNWDLAGAWACLNVAPVASVAERLKPEALFERFFAYRQSLGMTILPLTGGDVDVMSALADHLRNGGLVCLPADRDLSGRGVPVTLFGEQTRMPAGPAMLALRTGAPLVPVAIRYEGTEPDHFIVIHFGEPIATPSRSQTVHNGGSANGNGRIATMTQRLADAFAVKIAEYPADWHMMQRLFLADLRSDDPRRSTRPHGQE